MNTIDKLTADEIREIKNRPIPLRPDCWIVLACEGDYGWSMPSACRHAYKTEHDANSAAASLSKVWVKRVVAKIPGEEKSPFLDDNP